MLMHILQSINVFPFVLGIPLCGLIGFAAGFILRLIRNKKLEKKILRLENEMLKNHARILFLEKRKNELEKIIIK